MSPAVAHAAGASAGSALPWHSCVLGRDDTEGREPEEAGVQCAAVTVPLDHAQPHGRAITIAIARSRGSDTAHHLGSLVVNLGGPASPVLSSVPLARAAMGPTGERF